MFIVARSRKSIKLLIFLSLLTCYQKEILIYDIIQINRLFVRSMIFSTLTPANDIF